MRIMVLLWVAAIVVYGPQGDGEYSTFHYTYAHEEGVDTVPVFAGMFIEKDACEDSHEGNCFGLVLSKALSDDTLICVQLEELRENDPPTPDAIKCVPLGKLREGQATFAIGED